MFRSLSILLIAFVMCCVGCNTRSGLRHRLTLADVRIPDPEHEAIVKYHVRQVLGYDTADIFRRYPQGRKWYGKRISGGRPDALAPALLGYLIERSEFDSSGNKIYYYLSRGWGLCPGTHFCPHREYDPLGFMTATRSEHDSRCDTFEYVLLPDDRKLLQLKHGIREKANDTTVFYLHESGSPSLSVHYGYEKSDSVNYFYNASGMLTRTFAHNRQWYEEMIDTRYYYTNSHLDSAIINYAYPHADFKSINVEKRYYDYRGLPLKSLIADTLQVYYLLKTFADFDRIHR